MTPASRSTGCPAASGRAPCPARHGHPRTARIGPHPVQYVPHAFGWKAMNLPFASGSAPGGIGRYGSCSTRSRFRSGGANHGGGT